MNSLITTFVQNNKIMFIKLFNSGNILIIKIKWIAELLHHTIFPFSVCILRKSNGFKGLPGSNLCGLWEQQPKQEKPAFPLPRHFAQHFPADPKVFLDQLGDIDSSACPGSFLGAPPRSMSHLTKEASRWHPNKISDPPHLAEQWLYWVPPKCHSFPPLVFVI